MPTDNVYYVDSPDDIVTETPDNGRDRIYSIINYVLPANVEELVLYGHTPLLGTGNVLENLIVGNDGDNFVYGLAGNDSLYGDDGNDVLDGGSGNDLMVGGTGDDIYYVDSLGDNVVELSGEGNDKIFASMSYVLPGKVEELVLTGSQNLSAYGNKLDNLIIGNSGNNYLFGDDGKDHLIGGDGNDRLDGAWDADVMEGGKGDDIYYVNAFTYWGKRWPVILRDQIIEKAGEGHDLVYTTFDYTLPDNVEDGVLRSGSNPYPDYLVQWSLIGNALDNVLTFSPAEGKGHTTATLYGLGGNDILYGGGNGNRLFGGDGNDTIYGGAGTNSFGGDAGDDIIVAGPLKDRFNMDGAASGNDILIFKSAQHADQDRIQFFASGTGAKIDLSQIDASVTSLENDSFTFVDAFTETAGEVTIRPGIPDSIYDNPATTFEISGDTNGDGVADFVIRLTDSTISQGDLIL